MNALTYFLFRKRTFALSLGSLILLIIAKPSPTMFWIGVPLVIVGELIRLWSSGYLTKMQGLITAGPFAICRNPLYVGSFLMLVGYLIMCNRPIVGVLGVIIFWIFHCGAVRYEEAMLIELFGEEFATYCKRIPRFFPRIGSLAGEGEFAMSQLLKNNEYRGAILATVTSTLFGLIAYGVIGW